MRRLAAVLCFSLAFTLSVGCPHVTTPVKDCSAETAVGLIDDVNTALATQRYADSLAKLVADWGACVIEKVVQSVAQAAGLRAQYDELEAVKAQRARDWLAERGKPVAQRTEGTDMQIALVSHSKKISDGQVAAIADACNRQVIECAEAYGIPPTPVAFYATASDLPARFCRIMDLVDTIDMPGAAGYHANDAGIIYGRVLVRDVVDTGITVSHECLEMLVDPSCAGWRVMPDGFMVAHEICDPVQGDAYPVDVELFGLHYRVLLSNYVYPAWFLEESGAGQLDRMGRVDGPHRMTPGGYMIVRDSSGRVGNRFAQVRFAGDHARLAFATRFTNPDGRVQRRLAG